VCNRAHRPRRQHRAAQPRRPKLRIGFCADVERGLTAAGIQTKRYFRPAHTMRAYRAFATRPLPRTERVYARILCLPIFNEIRDAEVDEVAAQVSALLRSRSRGGR